MKKKFALLITVILSICCVFGTLAGCTYNNLEDWERIEKRGKIILGFDADIPPMGFKNSEGKYTGFDIDLAMEVGKLLGVKIVLRPIIWDEKEFEIKAKKVDVIWNGFTVTEQRKQEFDFSIPYLINNQVIVVRYDSEYQTVSDLKDKKIVLQGGSTAENAVKANEELKDNELVYIGNNVEALNMELATGKVDCAVLDSIMAKYYIENLGADQTKFRILENSELMHEEYAIGFRKGETVFIEKINEALRTLDKNGTIETIANKYFGVGFYKSIISQE